MSRRVRLGHPRRADHTTLVAREHVRGDPAGRAGRPPARRRLRLPRGRAPPARAPAGSRRVGPGSAQAGRARKPRPLDAGRGDRACPVERRRARADQRGRPVARAMERRGRAGARRPVDGSVRRHRQPRNGSTVSLSASCSATVPTASACSRDCASTSTSPATHTAARSPHPGVRSCSPTARCAAASLPASHASTQASSTSRAASGQSSCHCGRSLLRTSWCWTWFDLTASRITRTLPRRPAVTRSMAGLRLRSLACACALPGSGAGRLHAGVLGRRGAHSPVAQGADDTASGHRKGRCLRKWRAEAQGLAVPTARASAAVR